MQLVDKVMEKVLISKLKPVYQVTMVMERALRLNLKLVQVYGVKIYEALGDRPIGLIATRWGGSFIEVWVPPSVLQECNNTK